MRALDRLRDALGRDRVLDGQPAVDEIRRRSLNPIDGTPRALVRPENTEECRTAVELVSSAGLAPQPVGSLTTFWEPQPLDVDVAIDTLALRAPARVDADERIGYFGAGITVREVDQLARAHGLCLVAYPDSDGSTSVGSMAAVGCTSGLGLGRMQPVEQIVGLTIVTPDATILRTGTSWRLGHGGVAHGMPDPTGIFLASQGRLGFITEVVLTLAPAPFLAARTWTEPWRGPAPLADALHRMRSQMDQGGVDSLRLETGAPRDAAPNATEWFVRCWAADSADSAERRCAVAADALGARNARGWVESAAGRRGEPPDHDARYSLPPGTHHARTGGDGFLGIEVSVNWGAQLDPTLGALAELFATLRTLRPGQRRLGIYPGPHAVAIGVQAMLTGGEATADDVRDVMARFVDRLSVFGAVPYRPGRLWHAIVDRQERDDPACALVRRAVPS
jgi:FAD/FMN-containing dehydrogenase